MVNHNVMDRSKWPAISGLVLGTIALTRNAQTTFAVDKPYHSAIAILASSGGAVLGLSRFLPRGGERSHRGQQYESVPLTEVGQWHASREPSPAHEDEGHPSSLRKLRLLFAVLVLAVCLRADILRQVVRDVQCTATSWAPLIPLAFAAWDYWTVQRDKKRATYDDEEASVYDALEHFVVRAPYAFFCAIALVSVGGLMAISSTSSPASTYICAATLPHRWAVPYLQSFGSALDVVIVFCIAQLLTSQDSRDSRHIALRIASVGWALLFSAGVLLTIGTVYYIVQETDRKWILTITHLYFWSVAKLDLYVTFTLLCALILILHLGVMTTSLIATFTSIITIATGSAWGNGHPFPPVSIGFAFWGIGLTLQGFMIYFHVESTVDDKGGTSRRTVFNRVSAWFYFGLLVLFFVWTGIWASYKSEVNFHPIDMLLYEAQEHHQLYLNQTHSSMTLAEATKTYRGRYIRDPPPRFDRWYQYATERNSTVIDDFDSIRRDLLPFYALTPQEIRDRTWELISNPWNDAAGISIRGGKVEISPNVVLTHKWMLDGLVEMISKFAEWLPDMDLAFNLNDECRVAVPFENVEPMRQIGKQFDLDAPSGSNQEDQNAFSQNREEQWKSIPEEPNPETPLREISWQQTFHRFGNAGCPPNSPSRTQRLWDVSSLCISCTSPQSLGAFLANWTVAADICHQPDLADLHGLYLSPAAFKGTHKLYPIFSQSKAHGFNDILYPSAWNYLDKAKYAPNGEYPDKPFPEKDGTLFWRGATSEGFSHDFGHWRGMNRQRFIHLANSMNDTNAPQPLLLPSKAGKLEYKSFPVSKLTELLPTDVHIVDSILRCGGVDCGHQDKEFAPLVPPSDFQSHWKYKYLLDLDGAGFSGRFLPFLQSRSLPFKAALFREWWDDRVTPWLHFVPLDLRGHGFWATLAYFQGVEGEVSGKEVKLDAHPREAERIAETGREWAGQVLRKEDMEIYFFRLLLEWGRLTDDRRGEIGFAG